MNALPPLDVLDSSLDGVHLVEASAGTGKTWTICCLYLRLLLERELTVQQILVVTFTKAATAELRERIRGRIVEMSVFLQRAPRAAGLPGVPPMRSDLPPAPMVAEPAAHTRRDAFTAPLAAKLAAAGIDAAKALSLLQRALESFDEASVFTIHQFCQRAMAANPFSAGLPMRTEPVDDDRELLMAAVNDFWRRHVAAAAVSPELARFLNTQKDSPEKYARLLKRHLAKPLARSLWPADIDTPLIATAPLHALYREVCDTWQRDSDAIIARLLDSLSALHAKTYNVDSVRKGAEQWAQLCGLNSPYAEAGNLSRLYRASVLEQRKKKNCVPPRHPFFDRAEAYCALRERIEASFCLERLRLLRRLFEEAGSQLRDLKRSGQVISFDDMLSNIHERLHDPRYPWLAPSIRKRFPAALIDEFQDTDPLQFAIFRSIYGGGALQVFVVGDPKQAIYSFRHADLHTYLRARSWATKQWSLAANQRSSRPLVTALNGLFERNARAFILPGLDYRHVDYGAKPRANFIDGSVPRAPLQLWALPQAAGRPLHKNAARSAAVQAACAEIARLIEAGAGSQITLDGRPLCPRDIAVLVRTRIQGSEVKKALAELRVGAVEMSRASIFHSAEAGDLEIVLAAVLSPRESLLRAALATDLVGCGVAAIEAMAGDEALLMRHVAAFAEHRESWRRQGFGVMYRRLLADGAVARRMLLRPDGERRLTNYLHLGENLHRAAQVHDAPDALLRYLRAERDADVRSDSDARRDALQLRLESDQNLVQILTIHTCKGLEYPVVFCPFLCEGAAPPGGPALEGLEYHDEHLEAVIDFRRFADGDPAKDAVKHAMEMERAAERVRLLYVALSRAVHRCYLVTGCYFSGRSIKESTGSMLNWLVAGRGAPWSEWMKTETTPADIAAAWEDLARSLPCEVSLAPLPTEMGTPLVGGDGEAIMATLPVPSIAAAAWRLSSYSGLSFGARTERAADDRDARTAAALTADDRVRAASATAARPPAWVGEADILRFPRGPSAGECIHAMLESIDFTDAATWDEAITAALQSHPQTLPGTPQSVPQALLTPMLRTLARNVTETEILPGLQLGAIAARHRLVEMEFTFPVPQLSAADLNSALHSLGYEVPALQFNRLQGYLKGFIDLVFEHRGRYFIVDWKSNHLGYEPADYAAGPLAAAMTEHGYHLQYLLYSVALDRYLRRKIPGYCYEAHAGGVLYLFVRGVRPAWQDAGSQCGVYFHRPSREALQRLNDVLGSPLAEVC